jgi:hypothetical protein
MIPASQMDGDYGWYQFNFTAPPLGSNVTLTITSGKDTLCTSTAGFDEPQ